MSISPSNSFNNSRLLGTLRKSLKRFSSNPENNVIQKTEFIFNTDILKRSLSNTEESPQFRNYTQTLGRPKRFEESLPKSALAQAIEKFSDGGTSSEHTASEKPHTQNTSFIKTIKRSMSIRLVNLKKPEEINKCLEKAKKSFLDSEYKESKKLFEDLLGSKHLDTLEKKSEVSLYLTAIYLLEKDVSKAEEYLKGVTSSFLAIVILVHIKHLQSPSKDSPFPGVSCYKVEAVSEDGQIIKNRLFESFGKNTPT